MRTSLILFATVVLGLTGTALLSAPQTPAPLNVEPQPIRTDQSVKYDYDIVYVRAPRPGDDKQIAWTDVFAPLRAEPGSDLVVLHPDGKEEVLVAAGDDAITDPIVSFDAQWVYFARFHNEKPEGGERPLSRSSDIFKVQVSTRKVVPLTKQTFSPNTAVVAADLKAPGVYNLGPCPLPGGKVMFTSNRNGFTPSKNYKGLAASDDYNTTTLQLFVMDDDGSNVECVGHLNVNGALHPSILRDGRVTFTSFETQALRDFRMWGLWAIRPDGSHWEPLVSALGPSGETAYHFATQLSDGHIVFEEYYFQHNLGFGTLYKLDAQAPEGQPFFGPPSAHDPRNMKYGNKNYDRFPYAPHGLEWLTPFSLAVNRPARHPVDPDNPNATLVGKVTHPSAAPDNHLLTVWSPGPVFRTAKPAVDSGIYLLRSGKAINEPGRLLLIKNDPKYNEQWPRALVPYKRIHGIDEPARLPPASNDGKQSPHLPEGSPFGLLGTSSLYKRETYPFGTVPEGKVTASYDGKDDPFEGLGTLSFRYIAGNWFIQGADAGKYDNEDIHGIRILVTEPTTHPNYTGRGTRRWWSAANERFRILGEFPVRKFVANKQPLDPDGNPDTSFLVKLPADVPFTFQTLDKRGLVLNMAQTWHQLRPGEVRNDCGGCHAHSQKPTEFKLTAAAKADYTPFDLTENTPLLTTRDRDQSGKKWDANGETGLRYTKGVLNVEYFRDVKPILDRSCVACHTQRWENPAGNLVLDDNETARADHGFGPLLMAPPDPVPGTYLRLALDPFSKFGHKSPVGGGARPSSWPLPQGSRYVRYFQSRRSLLAWKIHGQRLDGFRNEDFAHETEPGNPASLTYQGKPFDKKMDNQRFINLAYTGSAMPPPEAVAGTYVAPDGKKIKVEALGDEDRRTIARWIDLGCPIDFDYDPVKPDTRGHGWREDDLRPTLTMTVPAAGSRNEPLTRILIGMYDYDSGVDAESLHVTADFAIDGVAAGEELVVKFRPRSRGVREWVLSQPVAELPRGTLVVTIKDRQGNLARVERSFSVVKAAK